MEDAGAVALIGNTATTYLNFSVAMVTGNQNPFNVFSPDEMGLFDAMMHPDYNSLGKILTEEKIAAERVTGMGDDLITWHIYAMNLLGDPSLCPYIGIPEEQDVSYELFTSGSPLFTISASPGTYYCVTDDNNTILGTGYIDESGTAFSNLTPINTTVIHLTVTGKNKIPYYESIAVVEAVENDLSAAKSNISIYPNPFNPSTKISFKINEKNLKNTELVIYNLKGQKVKTFIINPSTDQLMNSITWNGKDSNNKSVSSGIYYAVLKQNGNQVDNHKMLLIK